MPVFMSVQSLLITGDEEQLGFVQLAIGITANDVSRRGNTVHYKVYQEDFQKCVDVCKKLNVTVQTIKDVPCEIYPLLHQGAAKAVPPLGRWYFTWMKIIPGVPLFAWVNDDRSLTYKGPPFDGRACTFRHDDIGEWPAIGDFCEFENGLIYYCGDGGELKQFKTKSEAQAFADSIGKPL